MTFLPAVMAGEVDLEPREVDSGLVIGGNKSILFNAEYLISIAGPVRLVLFADTGQVQDTGQRFTWKDFKASTGAEVRFFMPVLNVPFRLIFAYNPLRERHPEQLAAAAERVRLQVRRGFDVLDVSRAAAIGWRRPGAGRSQRTTGAPDVPTTTEHDRKGLH